MDLTNSASFVIRSGQATALLTFSLLKVRAANLVREVVWNYQVGLFEPPPQHTGYHNVSIIIINIKLYLSHSLEIPVPPILDALVP